MLENILIHMWIWICTHMNSYMNSHFYDLIIWIHILNTSWYPQIHVFSWIHTRYCGFWPYFMEEIVFKFMSVVVWRALWKDREKYRDLIMAWSFKKSSPLNSLALCADALCLMGLAAASPSYSCCSSATCLTISWSVWQSLGANTCHFGLITHSVLAARAAPIWIS